MSAMVEAHRSRYTPYTPYTPTPLPISTHAPVLLVDDDESMREAVTLLLEEPGYAVTAMTNVVAAQGYLRAASCAHIVLLGFRLPNGNPEPRPKC